MVAASVIVASVCAAGLGSRALAQSDERPSAAEPERTPAQLYEAACASCHGIDGRGVPRSQVGFDLPIPDFADCNFATREPTLDWLAVAHRGGPARAFDEKMPAFGAALSEAELRKALDHVRTFCSDDAWPRGELNLPRALLTEKAFVEDEAVVTSGVTLEGPLEVSGKFIYETRFGPRSQVELVVPFAVMEREQPEAGQDGWAEGAGDIGFGAKHVLFHSSASGTIFSAAGEVFLPTGDEADGLGKGTFVFEPFLAFGQLFGDMAFIQLQAGVELPVDENRATKEGFVRGALGQTASVGRLGRSFSPMFELEAKRELDAGAAFEWTAVPQMQITLSRRRHVRLNVGLGLPLTELDARPTELLVYLLWDWFDGGLFEGW